MVSEALIIALVRSVRSFMVTADPDYSLIGRLAFHHLFFIAFDFLFVWLGLLLLFILYLS